MAQKKVLEILKLIEFLNEEVKEVSKRLSRVTPKEVSEKLGTLALIREKILNLQVDLPQEIETKLSQISPSIESEPNPLDSNFGFRNAEFGIISRIVDLSVSRMVKDYGTTRLSDDETILSELLSKTPDWRRRRRIGSPEYRPDRI